MNEDMKDILDPIIEVRGGWDELDTLDFIVYDVKFLGDFGPFKKNEIVPNLSVLYSSARFVVHNNDGEVIKECGIKLVSEGVIK